MPSETALLPEIQTAHTTSPSLTEDEHISPSNQLRATLMSQTCSVTEIDQHLLALFRLVTGNPQSDLCAFLSTRLTALQFSMIDMLGQWEFFISPDSLQQSVELVIRQGDVRYEFKRHLGQIGPYGGHYEGFKLYAEVGAIPISDSHVLQLLQMAIRQIQQCSDDIWHRRISLR